ncbi:MAG: GntR family transcriptional regulator [Nocardioidaceae bacterium]|nr:GntR family transcriptional regulator [Nocardioidaceae bacterium]
MNETPGRLGLVPHESTASLIADRLREAMARGDLAPGAQMAEAELARDLGVSRGPLREGMQRLTQEGLLVSFRHRGLFVIEMTPENVRDMYVARAAVERAAAREIFQHDSSEAGAVLGTVIARMDAAARRRKVSTVSRADMEFHETLVSLAGSERLTRMHRTLLTETQMCIQALEETYDGHDVLVQEHRGIAEAIALADAVLTDQLILAHMEDAVTRLTNDAVGPVDKV